MRDMIQNHLLQILHDCHVAAVRSQRRQHP
ncbi:hypothetical protein MJ561_18805 [Klebsiella pneumoniae]|nr:hypothetical protein MJ561_18805 [Klebsiella pneumoniae]